MAVANLALSVANPFTLAAISTVTFTTIATTTTGGVYVWETDLQAMVNGDVFELRIYMIVNGAAVKALAYYAVYAHAQAQPVKLSVPVPLLAGDTIEFTANQTAGTLRAFRNRVVSIG